MDLAATGLHLLYGIAALVLTSLGLASGGRVRRVVSVAHGEFLMLGGDAFGLSVHAGVNLWVAMFVVAPLAVGVFGALVERLVSRHLYGRVLGTILATWGLSLFLIGLASATLGFQQRGGAPPL